MLLLHAFCTLSFVCFLDWVCNKTNDTFYIDRWLKNLHLFFQYSWLCNIRTVNNTANKQQANAPATKQINKYAGLRWNLRHHYTHHTHARTHNVNYCKLIFSSSPFDLGQVLGKLILCRCLFHKRMNQQLRCR